MQQQSNSKATANPPKSDDKKWSRNVQLIRGSFGKEILCTYKIHTLKTSSLMIAIKTERACVNCKSIYLEALPIHLTFLIFRSKCFLLNEIFGPIGKTLEAYKPSR